MLYQKILNKLDEERGLSDELAILAGYKSGQTLRKALRENREFGSFQGLVCLVQELFPNDEIKLLSDYAKEVDPNKQTARYMLEYLNLHKQFDILRELINSMLVCGNNTSKEWASVYNIDLRITEGKLNNLDAISEFGRLNLKSTEAKVCNEIMKSYCYLTDKNYNFSYQIASLVENSIGEINEIFIKDLFLGRVLLIISECHQRNDEVKKARSYQERIIAEIKDIKIKALSYLHLGNSFIMESCDNAIECFRKGMELAEDNHILITNFKRSINFTCNFWKNIPPYLNHNSKNSSDIHEIAFSKINDNQFGHATEILNQVNIKELNDNSLGFHYYLRGLISNKEDDFCQSAISFKSSSDFHFIKLPLLELRKKGYSEMLIKLILT